MTALIFGHTPMRRDKRIVMEGSGPDQRHRDKNSSVLEASFTQRPISRLAGFGFEPTGAAKQMPTRGV